VSNKTGMHRASFLWKPNSHIKILSISKIINLHDVTLPGKRHESAFTFCVSAFYMFCAFSCSYRLQPCRKDVTRSSMHRKKKVREFPVPSRDVTTKLSQGGNNDVIMELFLPRGSLVCDIPAGDGKLANLFLRCGFMRDRWLSRGTGG
jgi:hypothetical protein